MRIKIIGNNNCARATRYLLRMAGLAVTEFLPADAVTQAPHFGCAITIDLAPAVHTPDPTYTPDHSTHGKPAEADREASPAQDGASSSFVNFSEGRLVSAHETQVDSYAANSGLGNKSTQAGACATPGHIRFDLADSALEAAIRPGGVLHSWSSRSAGERKLWWSFCAGMLIGALLTVAANANASPHYSGGLQVQPAPGWTPIAFTHAVEARAVNGASLHLEAALAPLPPPAQFATGQQMDPCKGQTKLYVSINQTANTQLATGTSGSKIYICSIHVVVAAATNVALVEGTGSVCGTGTAGVSGFGGATAATGWNFTANGGIVLGNGDVAVGAQGTSGDNLCLYNSGSGQVSGGISYVVQ